MHVRLTKHKYSMWYATMLTIRNGRLTIWVVVEIYHPDPHGSDSDLGLVPGGKVKLVKSASVDVSMSNARWEI